MTDLSKVALALDLAGFRSLVGCLDQANADRRTVQDYRQETARLISSMKTRHKIPPGKSKVFPFSICSWFTMSELPKNRHSALFAPDGQPTAVCTRNVRFSSRRSRPRSKSGVVGWVVSPNDSACENPKWMAVIWWDRGQA